MIWMPDACVISVVAPALVDRAQWKADTWVTSECCAQELMQENRKQSPQSRLMRMMVGDAAVVTVMPVVPHTPAWTMLFQHLRPDDRSSTANLGEQECIALCTTTVTDSVFTSLDKKALALALAEIGSSRVAHPFEMIASMWEGGLIDDAARDLAWHAIQRHSNQPPPWRFREPGS